MGIKQTESSDDLFWFPLLQTPPQAMPLYLKTYARGPPSLPHINPSPRTKPRILSPPPPSAVPAPVETWLGHTRTPTLNWGGGWPLYNGEFL